MTEQLTSAPALSTPDNHILAETEAPCSTSDLPSLSEDQFLIRYEIERTLSEIRQHQWRRVALQFPDHMLPHSAKVYQLLSRGLSQRLSVIERHVELDLDKVDSDMKRLAMDNDVDIEPVKLTILADTSYGSCCVDEIAAEHVNADAVIHYGRACLSPTARLPVLHIFTSMPLDHNTAIQSFSSAYPDHATRVIITGDIPYAEHIQPLTISLTKTGYTNIFAAQLIHNPSSAIPNRTLPSEVNEDPTKLSEWHIFHIAEPPTALLLTLSSRVASVRIHDPSLASTAAEANTSTLLRRRYALTTSMSTVSTWGILINTLSVKNYLPILEHIKRQIAAAGKKSYLFVVGKVNTAKIANFAEIGGWVVIGCWESSLIDSRDFYKPILTPFELELALASDDQRIWTGAWRSNFQDLLDRDISDTAASEHAVENTTDNPSHNDDPNTTANELIHPSNSNSDSDSESVPPEFDLRTGRYISHSRPLNPHYHRTRQQNHQQQAISSSNGPSSKALTKHANGTIATVNGIASPAAEYLRQKRTWKGLGSDFEIRYEADGDGDVEGALIEEGRTGVAGGYTVGEGVRN